MTETWDIPSAIALYNIDRWGTGYFTINGAGNVQVMPTLAYGKAIDLMDVISEARDRGMAFPLVIRFQDLLRHRVETINRAFQSAIAEANYQNVYKGVFPIKVNQLREVIEEIMDAGRPFNFGLEAGSKPELIAALAVHRDPDSLIICNGYKDPTFIQNALLGRKLGKQVIMVVEKLEEVRQILQVSREMNVMPLMGLRVRLQSKGSGKWATSGGENAKFGLSTADLVSASNYLKSQGMAESLVLVHFHVGSQVPDIGVIKRAVREAARFYAKLSKMGHPMQFVDVGGGLGVDYDGSRTAFDSSMNYTLQEYARDVVYNIIDVCESEKVPHPIIVSESGRAIVAHHSVLVVEAFSSIEKGAADLALEISETDPKLLHEMVETQKALSKQNRMEVLHDAQQIKEQCQSMFELGLLDLESKAKIEIIYWQIAQSVVELCRGMRYVPDEVKELETALGDQYLCNFSVFQSLLDHWALGQLFPIMPVHHLEQPPDRNGTLVDITCDSDGKVSKFIDLQDVKETLPLHRMRPGEPYYLGFFLMGAYQDIMGDLHNLFGRANEVHVFLDEDEDSGWYIEEVIEGSTVGSVLSMTQWDQHELIRLVKGQVDAAIKTDRLKPNEAMRLLSDYERGLKGYTYLNFQNGGR
ncbi:MAG: biosynthetic arginine decarboxylase [Verrucomicrobia bacterium]|jgi:arginine decarboxylase|nr:biosynthetic arginine decarboxylase [Verrucomicrobiota bacterium]MBV8533282.1 biosynthetic arginine decarboxylase [Verrucomicrobiota bacterium]